MHDCGTSSAILIFSRRVTDPLLHIPSRQAIVSFTQDASAHNRPFDGMHSGYEKDKKEYRVKSFIRGKRLSSANGLNLTQMSQ